MTWEYVCEDANGLKDATSERLKVEAKGGNGSWNYSSQRLENRTTPASTSRLHGLPNPAMGNVQ